MQQAWDADPGLQHLSAKHHLMRLFLYLHLGFQYQLRTCLELETGCAHRYLQQRMKYS